MEKKTNFILGIVGALAGALIGTIPWILMYVYANMIYAVLAIIVAICALKGYELMKGKVDKKLPYIIGIVSFLAITIATLVIIPSLLMIKEGITFSIANLKILYQNEEFFRAIMGDYAISIIFTILGIFSILKTIKIQVNMGRDKIDLKYEEKLISDEKLAEVKKVFENHNATSKDYTISKEVIINEANITEDELNYLIRKALIRVRKGKFYFCSVEKNNKVGIIIGIVVIVIAIAIIIITSVLSNTINDDKKTTTNNYNNYNNKNNNTKKKDVSYNISSNYVEYENDEVINGKGWYYVPKKDLSGNSGVILVSTFEDNTLPSDVKEIKKEIDASAEESESIISKNDYYNKNKYYVLEYVLDYDGVESYVYYIFNGSKYAIVDGFDYTNKYDIKIQTKNIADTFKWK